jgi:hypothetical protein
MEVVTKTGTGAGEEFILMAIREALPQPFEADDWTDLRVGWFMSITDNVDAQDPTVDLSETIGTLPRPLVRWFDRVAIGVIGGTQQSDAVFLGFTNAFRGRVSPASAGASMLVSSDGGIGTSNTNFWRFKNELSDDLQLQIIDGGITRAWSRDGCQVHFAQDSVAGYATLIALRFTRPDSRGRKNVITMQCKSSVAHSGDVIYSDTPTAAILEANLESFPTTVQTLGPVELSSEPTYIYWYWPFSGSRLRIHARGIVKRA